MAEPTLSAIMAKIVTIELEQRQQTALLTALVTGEQLMANQLDTIITALNDNTNAVSARLDRLLGEIGDQVTADQRAQLQAIADHLKALGQDPANPVPVLPAPLA